MTTSRLCSTRRLDFGVVGGDGVGDVLQHHRLAGARRRDDQRALAFAERRDQVDDPSRQILAARILEFELELLFRIERGQVVEIDALAHPLRIVEIDAGDLEQREITLAVARRADLALDGVAGAQPEAPHLARADIDVVGSRQVIRLGRAQEAEPVRHHFQHAVARDRHLIFGELLQDREQHVLLAQGGSVLDFEFLGKGEQLGGGFPF
jgi:hypothetical protein